jgi:hypothetical protein
MWSKIDGAKICHCEPIKMQSEADISFFAGNRFKKNFDKFAM